MKSQLATAACLVALITLVGSRSMAAQAGQGAGVDERVAKLEARLAGQEETVGRLEDALEELAAGAKEMAATLDQSEAEGFTAGINFRSRETLLAGWRAYLARVEKAAATVRPEEEESARTARAR